MDPREHEPDARAGAPEGPPSPATQTPHAGDPVDPDTLRHLDWATLLARFVDASVMPLARERAERGLAALRKRRAATTREALTATGLDPSGTGAQLLARFAELRFVERVLERESESGEAGELRRRLGYLEDLDASLDAAVRGETLEIVELAGARELLDARGYLVDLSGGASFEAFDRDLLASLGAVSFDPSSSESAALASELRRCIDLDGEEGPQIADDASPALAEARGRSRSVRRELSRAAEAIVRRRDVAECLQDGYWTFRDGRAVLPVKSGSLGPFKRASAIIHGSSQSGQTIFVEPRELVDANNQLREAERTVRAELARIRQELSRALGRAAPQVREAQAAALRLAQAYARLELSRALDGVEPRFADPDDDDARIFLPVAKHPSMVLDGHDVVPNTLELGVGKALVISGPNAGGKTVALKTLGACMLLARAGVRIPCAEGAELPVFERLVTDVGDDQSIAADLSTFSAQVAHVRTALKAAKEAPRRTLVLLDEIAVGTDPEQGAALAEAMLLGLVDRGATVVVTTHYERLKLLGRAETGTPGPSEDGAPAGDPRFVNAAVGFDLERLAPTFRLRVGVPGSSSALAVARRLGLQEQIVAKAEAMLDDAALRVDVLLQAIAQEQVALQDARRELERDKAAVRRRSSKLEHERKKVEAGAKSRRAKAWSAAADELRALERELKARRKSLRRAESHRALPTKHEATRDAKQVLERERERPEPAPGRAPDEVTVGQSVEVPSLGQRGEVVAVKGNKVTVQLDNLRTTLPRRQLRAVEPSKARPKAKRGTSAPVFEFRKRASQKVTSRHFGDDPMPVEVGLDNACRLVGARVEEAHDRLEQFLSDALAKDLDIVVVQHGHGSGALRSAVRESLRNMPYVRKHRAGIPREGGDAVTIVWLAD